MLKKISRKILPNPLDSLLIKASQAGHKKFLLAWNRGLGDIALGLFAIIHRIRTFVPQAEITFLIRPNLREGFSLLKDIQLLIAPHWKRGSPQDIPATLNDLGIDPSSFDVLIEKPDPTYWVRWQLGKLTPRLEWKEEWDSLWKEFEFAEDCLYIGVQPQAETSYGLWRNWPEQRWHELFSSLSLRKNVRILLFGYETTSLYPYPNLIDLRGKTSLFQLLSLIKNRCSHLILPDSGILSMAYYLNASFPLHIISLWGDPRHGILKQGVSSPNPLLRHTPLIASGRDLSTVFADDVLMHLFPEKAPQ